MPDPGRQTGHMPCGAVGGGSGRGVGAHGPALALLSRRDDLVEVGGARDLRGWVGLLGPHVDPPAAPGQVVAEPGADAEGVQQDGDGAQAPSAHGEGEAGVGLERGDDAEEAAGDRGAHGGGLVGAHEAVEPVAAG